MSCLFESLSSFIENVDHFQLRNIICDYIATNPRILDSYDVSSVIWETNITLQQYVENMRNPSTWGGALEIKAFCNIFNIDVVVHHTSTNKEIEFKSDSLKIYQKSEGSFSVRINLLYNGNHYDPKNMVKNIFK
jgi:hypothetical protein